MRILDDTDDEGTRTFVLVISQNNEDAIPVTKIASDGTMDLARVILIVEAWLDYKKQ